MKVLKLMADYECFPIWYSSDEGLENIDPELLPISTELKRKLREWSDKYDNTLNIDDPMLSGFRTEDEFYDFKREGEKLKEELSFELEKMYSIVYFQG